MVRILLRKFLSVYLGVIPPQDYDFLYQTGVASIFGPGTRLPVAAMEVLELIEKNTKSHQDAV